MATNLQAADGFLRSNVSKLSRPGLPAYEACEYVWLGNVNNPLLP